MTHIPAPRSALALAPGRTSLRPGTGANTEPAHPTQLCLTVSPLPPSKITRRPILATDTALIRGGDGYFDWLDHVWPAAGCTRPIRLLGHLDTVDTRTGEVLATTPTSALPDGVIYKACGNRRHIVCPSCAYTYQGDAYQLIRTGLTGGKTVPTTVNSHPAVFATLTAPSFGPVHARHVKHHTCRDKTRCGCRPDPCHARRTGTAEVCPHGITLACFARHESSDQRLGKPLCLDCYDHDHHVIWNQHAGELWRRTKQAAERYLNRLARQRRLPSVRLSHGKAAEYQQRGIVHFHALLRLDGIDSIDLDAVIPPPSGFTVADLDDAIRYAVIHTRTTTPGHPENPGGWPITWGDPAKALDIRPITLHTGDTVTDAMVAAYLAKYATKGTEITGHASQRLTPATVRLYADPGGDHTARLIAACWTLGEHPDHAKLRRWAHMLGFGGHFLTKARRYSITFAALRAARIHYRRTQTQGPDHPADAFHRQDNLGDQTTLIVGTLTYVGTGWHTTADALLANTAADQARRRHQAGREELAHEHAQGQQPHAA
ncbi:replication initiator [Actinomadura sp. 6N118]|uniref:replication initiator n=1 Tax=Actinomadura sp. 6N118 TaxID=3375151 RepID=UPI0037B24D7C